MRDVGSARTGLAIAGALWLLTPAGLPAVAAEAIALPAYKTAPGAKVVNGGGSDKEGPLLQLGTYTDAIGPGEKKYYTVELDAASDAYLSAVAAPPPGQTLKSEELKVTLAHRNGRECDVGRAKFTDGDSAHPLAVYAVRRLKSGITTCRQAGTYRVTVERTRESTDTTSVAFPLELKYMSEPGLKTDTSAASLSEAGSWSSTPPTPPSGPARAISGGTGFNDAPAVGSGVWKDEAQPGETRFYRIPVTWGQQLFVTTELPEALAPSGFYVADGIRVGLNNPARGTVKETVEEYQGKTQTIALGTAPVAYDNRLRGADDPAGAMRVAGWYYLQVGVHQKIGEVASHAVPVTLRISVTGRPKAAPAYNGDVAAAGFDVTSNPNAVTDESEGLNTRSIIGYTGIGTGSALLVWLGTWWLAARLRPHRDGT